MHHPGLRDISIYLPNFAVYSATTYPLLLITSHKQDGFEVKAMK